MARKVLIKAISNALQGEEDIFRLTDEWICIANEGTTTEFMEGWILLNRKPDNKHYHHFYFPAEVMGIRLNFKPGQLIFIMTGTGKDCYYPATEGNPGQYHFFQGLEQYIWNEPGDRVSLYSIVKERTKEGPKESFELVAFREVSE
ncbi:MAG: hypothetical protein GXY50_04365 [Syntrophomonadaceae bacterium]|nr:hypothetical protein [Syntrophomonadaceae bacterium]